MGSPTQITYHERRPVLLYRKTVLRVLKGADKDRSCKIDLHRVRVGTAPGNDLVLSDPQVSRNHLELRIQEEGYLLVDLGSSNGTYYRGSRVREMFVPPSAEFRLGNTILRLEKGEESTEEIKSRGGFGRLIGASPAMQEVYGVLAAVAPTDITVLIEGETGTGKEVVAEELHRQSPRREGSFQVVDCGAIPRELIESELFGHERGAFTGASKSREGMFEKARGGSLFLDEIGELPLDLQTRLLRVLDRRTVKRLGSDLSRSVDVRLMAATNRDLSAEVQANRFRKDLYYRLAVVRIALPPLRDRKEDIIQLARHFLWQAGSVDPQSVLNKKVLKVLSSRSWPGNVRELRNVMEKSVIFADGITATPSEDLATVTPEPEGGLRPLSGRGASTSEQDGPLDTWLARVLPQEFLELPYKVIKEQIIRQFEMLYMGHLHRRHGNNVARIARHAAIDRRLARQLLRKHGFKKS